MSKPDPALLAAKFVQNSKRHLFLTGKAGTGKTTFLKKIINETHKKAIIAAPTGIAAINAGGVTIHSLFQLPFGSFVPERQASSELVGNSKISDPYTLIRYMKLNDKKRALLKDLELLIIDEVSMLRADVLDAIDTLLKHVRKNSSSFGGLQVLFIGDLLQLPPVVKNDEWALLGKYYNSLYFFDAHCLRNETPVYIELEKIYRQDDQQFIELLNHLRNNTISTEDVKLLNRYYKPGFKPDPKEQYITLTTHNNKADTINREFLTKIEEKPFFYDAEITGEFPENAYPMEERIELKKGAQIMFTKNDPTGQQRFFNGKIATITYLDSNTIKAVTEDSAEAIQIEKYEWKNLRFELNEKTDEIEEKIIGTFVHYPIKLAWAITVHKSQGLTFSKAIIDPKDAFAPGQVYVALSRLRSLDGLVLTSELRINGLSPDYQVQQFADKKPDPESLKELIIRESDHYLRDFLIQAFELKPLFYLSRQLAVTEAQDEGRSIRLRDTDWQKNITEKLEPLIQTAQRFQNQIAAIIGLKKENYRKHLEERVTASQSYFVPALWEIVFTIIDHLKIVREAKKSKSYFNDLLQLETAVYKQIKLIIKSELLTKAIGNEKEISKSELIQTEEEKKRSRLFNELSQSRHFAEEEEEMEYRINKKEKKKKIPKEAKPNTRQLSYDMFIQGLSMEEIAEKRNLTLTTIASHLSTYIETGELDVLQFISEEKNKKIRECAEENGTDKLSPLQEILGNDYAFWEIRMAIAYMKAQKST